MLFSYITTAILAAATFVTATPTLGTNVKRQELPVPSLYGPFRLRMIAPGPTYRNRYAWLQAYDAVRPAPLASASVFNYENATGRLWVGDNILAPTVGGLKLNLTSNLAPLAFGPLLQPSCAASGGVTYETLFNFDGGNLLTLAGVNRWRGCTSYSSIGVGPGINFQFGQGTPTVPDCQIVQLQYETVVRPST
ncbi:hypothetical protein Dda_2420 [Drechslerella dactyloides]|uniref:Uncharacterized protein n=1 Tax=Drechslerella dactyloides TaxID=74499 RepID=A0AAD6J3J5_DREDA|nr:hypothetical protein Dda_2420 [Drechslerella dactyloides]